MAQKPNFTIMDTNGPKKAKKNWENVYVLRQEYHPDEKCWFPVILYWNRIFPENRLYIRSWVEGIFMETHERFFHIELKESYHDITRPGTDKCDPKDVKDIMEFFLDECKDKNQHEVKKLSVFAPELR